MEASASSVKDGTKNLKNRLMGKAGKLLKERQERKHASEENTEQDVDGFLRPASSDKLFMMPTSNNPSQLPPLMRLDTNAARRWPAAADVNNIQRSRSTSPRPKGGRRKGLVVRFTEAQPEVIGVGGDEATLPVAEIGARKRAHSHPPMGAGQTQLAPGQFPSSQFEQRSHEQAGTVPPPLPFRQPQNRPGSLPYPEDSEPPVQYSGPPILPEIGSIQSGMSLVRGDENQSFAARVQAEMRSGEGKALVQAASESSPFDQHFPKSGSPLPPGTEVTPELNELHINTLNNTNTAITANVPTLLVPRPPPLPAKEQIPAPSVTPPLESGHRPHSPLDDRLPTIPVLKTPELRSSAFEVPLPKMPASPQMESSPRLSPESNKSLTRPPIMAQSSNLSMHDVVGAVGEEALQDFSRRSSHLYTLFRLSAESVKPLPKCSPQELVRVALWWFLKGRSSLETSIRERPINSDEHQQSNILFRQQAHADLAKALWIIENVTSQYPQRQTVSTGPNTLMADLLSAQQSVMSSLKKLAVSMKRNNFLPPDPDNAPLPQGVDNTIWVADDGNRSLIANQRFLSVLSLSESFSLGDTEHHFQYGRMFVEAIVLEEAASQYYRCHVLLSILRSQNEKGLTVTIASQDGLLNLGIQHDRKRGPSWEDVTWQSNANTFEVNLTRGFVLRIHCQGQDYGQLWNLYALHNEIYAILEPRAKEMLIFDATVKTFQQFILTSGEPTPTAPLPNCYLRVFQKLVADNGTARLKHRGFRIGLCTNSKTKNLKGVDRTLLPNVPIQFGYLRGDGGFPALLLKSSDEESENNIVFTFEDENQRTRLHTLLTGLALGDVEEVVMHSAVKGFSVTNDKKYHSECLKYLDWKSLKVINESYGEVQPSNTINSDHLRIVLDFKAGTITDRLNLAPGELKIRLDVTNPTELKLLRQPQQDMTISVSEAQVMKELPAELTDLLRIVGRYETTRSYTFTDVNQLHLFTKSLTGFDTLFDGIAVSFNISRRRMVVPIYKKWDAAATRIQLVEKDKVIQLVAFFSDFSHGSCMSLTLKSTDVFEASGRSNKFTVKIVDAKFALPKTLNPAEPGVDHEFVCLDLPEYASEHDDITIIFDAESGELLLSQQYILLT